MTAARGIKHAVRSASCAAVLAAVCASLGCAPDWRPGALVVPPPRGMHFVEVAARTEGLCLRERSGRVGCMAWNDVAARAFEVDTDRGFQWVAGIDDADELAVGGSFACALRRNGRVACWGTNSGGELGDWAATGSRQAADVPGIEGTVALSVGMSHACAALSSGRVRCWGSNRSSQLGDGTAEKRPSSVEVAGVELAVGVATGSDHSCALLASGGVLCWGENKSAQLGDGSHSSSRTPVAVRGLDPADSIVAGWEHTCARLRRGPVVCWGHNSNGQRGLGGTEWRDGITEVPLPGTAQRLRAGVNRTCAVIEGSGAVCWGGWYGDDPDLDWREKDQRDATVAAIPSLRYAVQAAPGSDFVCGVEISGTVHCAGGLSRYGTMTPSPF
jgi:Regulator of chromosome condensation (RCC1) repeat